MVDVQDITEQGQPDPSDLNNAVIDPNPDTGDTPLHVSASQGRIEIVSSLLENNADVNLRNKLGEVPLHSAARQGHLEVIQLLLARGADVNATSKNGSSALYLASQRNRVGVVRALLKHDPLPDLYYGSEGSSPLAAAICYDYAEVVALLLEAGVDVKRLIAGRWSPLAWAVNWNSEASIRVMLEYQPELGWKDAKGYSILHYINQATPVGIVERLIRRGADPELANANGASVIWAAVQANNQPIAQYLASVVKVNLNIPVGDETLLHLACRCSSLNMVQTLVDAGAKVDRVCPGSYGTPLQATCCRIIDSDHSDETVKIVDYLVQKGARVNCKGGNLHSTLHRACLSGAPEVIEYLLAAGAEVDCKDSIGRSPVHLVCYRGLEHYQLLHPRDDALVAPDSTHRTALHYAVMSGDLDLVRQVVESHKRHPDHKDSYQQLVDNDGWTPLHWAARCVSPMRQGKTDMRPVIQYLLDEGYDRTAKAKVRNQEWTALDIAIYQGADEMVKAILIPVEAGERLKVTQRLPGKRHDGDSCDICFLPLVGFVMKCEDCYDFRLCFKCQASRELLHPAHHRFWQMWREYDSRVEEWQPPKKVCHSSQPSLASTARDGYWLSD
ncbi:ankyrin-2 [Aspergillus brasiliensis]|uniref:Ankyrin-2 n=1 Tax=Aspergillus brasiliensis TaxID=319629 RepID=A0A9W6DPS5_9EURO|nr:ankyrin-2 [Aspergillus brasiliensis]GKZ49172.1 ankyrin-2 [Aspergillus brasiliensis]